MAFIAERLDRIKPSPSSMASGRAKELIAQGVDLCAMTAGEPDFDTPPHIIAAAYLAMQEGQTRYTAVDGTPALKKAIMAKFERDNGLHFTQDQISVGAGGKQVIYNAFACTINDGDEVIVPAPYWVSYPDMVRLNGGVPVFIETTAAQGYKITPAQLAAALTTSTKWLVLNSPNNPSGAVYTEAELRALGEVISAYPNVHVMTDDIYEHLIYDGRTFTSFAKANPSLASRTLTVNGVSKAFAMTGWRVGYAGGPAPLIKAMVKLQSQSTGNPSSISQAAALAALQGPTAFLAEWRDTFQRRRDLIVSLIDGKAGLSCPTPAGAFYVYISCAEQIGKRTPKGNVIHNDLDFVMYLLDDYRVASVHGAAYGISPSFRLSFATSDDVIVKACTRIVEACHALSS